MKLQWQVTNYSIKCVLHFEKARVKETEIPNTENNINRICLSVKKQKNTHTQAPTSFWKHKHLD